MTRALGASAWFERLASLAVARPWRTVCISMLVFVVALLSALTLRPGTAVQDMLGERSPSSVAFGTILERFALVDDLSILVELPEHQDASHQQELLAFAERFAKMMRVHEEVAEVSWQQRGDMRPFVEQVVLPHLPWFLDEQQREALKQRLTPEAMREQMRRNAALLTQPGAGGAALREAITNDPLRLRELLLERVSPDQLDALGGSGAMLSADGRALLIRVVGTRPANDLPFAHRVVSLAQQAISRSQPGDLGVGITGSYAIADYTARSTRSDMVLSMLSSLALLSVLFLWVYRSWHAWPVTMLTLNTAIVAAFGLYAALGGRLSPVTAVTGAVLAGLGIDYCIHTLAHTQAHRHAGRKTRDAVVRAVCEAGPAMSAACLTSAAGFAAVAVSDVRSLREFALLGVIGLVLSLLAAVTLFPALLVLIYRKRDAAGIRSSNQPSDRTRLDDASAPTDEQARRLNDAISRGWIERGVERIAYQPMRWIAASSMVLTVMIGIVAMHGRHPVLFADDLESLHPQPNPPLQVQQRVAERFGISPGVMMVLVQAEQPGELLNACQSVQQRLRALSAERPELGEVIGPANLLPPADRVEPDWNALQVDRVMRDLDEAIASSPFDPSLFTSFRSTLERMLLPTDRPGLSDLQGVIETLGPLLPRDMQSDEAGPPEALVLIRPAIPWEQLPERGETVRAVRDALSGQPATLTGLAIIGLDTQATIANTLLSALSFSAVVIFIAVWLYFRRMGDAALAVLPAVAGLLALGSVLSLTHHELNAINLIALPLTLGLGVDDGIFLVSVARRLRRGDDAIRAWSVSGRAIVMTTATTLLAFGSLAFTRSPAVESLGVLSAVGVGACLAATMALLLPMLILLRGSSPGGDRGPRTLQNA